MLEFLPGYTAGVATGIDASGLVVGYLGHNATNGYYGP
jgi:hypothetical protein